MSKHTEETIYSIYCHVSRWNEQCRKARNKETNQIQNVMLRGKVKAYTDVLAFMKEKYSGKMTAFKLEKNKS